MSCNCSNAGKIPRCTDTLTLGTIADFVEPVYVVIKNLATGRTHIESGTSGAAGEVTLDMTLPSVYFYADRQTFKIHVSKQSSDNINDAEDLTINTVTDTCFHVNFETVYDQSGDVNAIAAQTL